MQRTLGRRSRVARSWKCILACAIAVSAAVPVEQRSDVERWAASVSAPRPTRSDTAAIRVNQLGYLPSGRKVAVVCATAPRNLDTFTVVDVAGRRVLGPLRARATGAFGPCASTHSLDFSALRTLGNYRVTTAGLVSPPVRIAPDVYAGAADVLLRYMRQQRSGWNPLFRDSVHTRDGILVDHPRAGERIPVSGGWADAADYLQYVTTSANATFVMLMAWRNHSQAVADAHQANGLPGANGIPDVLDEARHGLQWLVRMFADDSLLLNQLGDDRDHAYLDLPTTDSSDYGWGKGGPRPVYPCTGKPQGLLAHKNRSTGWASTAGKYAAAFALGASMLGTRDHSFAETLARKARAAYELGVQHPGVCQTAPAGAPYFYEEDNWLDDMQLGAAELHALTRESRYLRDALRSAREAPVTPWMGADTARHYQWYPWHNNGHYEIWRLTTSAEEKRRMAEYYRRGLDAVARRAQNGFRVGIPFIWCSNNLMASFATQAWLYRRMMGDARFIEYETAALDWLFGTNPWGTSMVIGLPANGVSPRDPHSVVSMQLGPETQTGGLVDGPVYRSIFQNLKWVRLTKPDRYAAFNTGFIVYHDDFGDYSTNEPTMDGTANLTYLLAAMTAQQP
ncbi:MAG: glycoside hydrolase family 9 protein [Gemmatimonadaceae bacterium]